MRERLYDAYRLFNHIHMLKRLFVNLSPLG